MVQFKDISNIASSPNDLLSIIILQRHTDLIEAIEQFEKLQETSDPTTNIIRARTISLFREIKIMLKRTISDQDFERLKLLAYSYDYEELDQAFDIIDTVLDGKNIIRPDFMKRRPTKSKISEENDAR